MKEGEAQNALKRLLASILGTAVNQQLIEKALRDADSIAALFPGSMEIARSRDAIRRRAEALRPPLDRPERCKALAEALANKPSPSIKVLCQVLKDSRFAGSSIHEFSENDCLQRLIGGPLDAIVVEYRTGNNTSSQIQLQIEQLEQLLEALPQGTSWPHITVTDLIHELRARIAELDFQELSNKLQESIGRQQYQEVDRYEQQLAELKDWCSQGELAGAWTKLDQMKKWSQLSESLDALAAEIPAMLEKGLMNQAGRDLCNLEKKLNTAGLSLPQKLQAAAVPLLNYVQKEHDRLELNSYDESPKERMSSVNQLNALSDLLEQLPKGERRDRLRQQIEHLRAQMADRWRAKALRDAQHTLAVVAVQDVPDFLARMEASNPGLLLDWVEQIRFMVEFSTQLSASNELPFEKKLSYISDFSKLERCINGAAGSLLAATIRDQLGKLLITITAEMVREIENALKLSGLDTAKLLAGRITQADSMLSDFQDKITGFSHKYRAVFPAAWKSLEGEWQELDMGLRALSDHNLPEALRAWTRLAIAHANMPEQLNEEMNTLRGWKFVLSRPSLMSALQSQLREAALRLRIGGLEIGGFDEFRKQIEKERAFLLPIAYKTILDFFERRLAAKRYRPGEETAVAKTIQEHGPDEVLVGLLINNVRSTGQTRALADVAGVLKKLWQNENDVHLARWCELFNNGETDELIGELSSGGHEQALEDILPAIERSEKHLDMLKIIVRVLQNEEKFSPALKARLIELRNTLQKKMEDKLDSIDAEEQELRQEFTASRPPLKEPRSDAELREKIEESSARAETMLQRAGELASVWLAYLEPVTGFAGPETVRAGAV